MNKGLMESLYIDYEKIIKATHCTCSSFDDTSEDFLFANNKDFKDYCNNSGIYSMYMATCIKKIGYLLYKEKNIRAKELHNKYISEINRGKVTSCELIWNYIVEYMELKQSSLMETE